MNLYQKLKPEIKHRLHRNSNNYAISVADVIKSLKSKKIEINSLQEIK